MDQDFPVKARRRVHIPAAAMAVILARMPIPIQWVSARLDRLCVQAIEVHLKRENPPGFQRLLRSTAAWLLEVPPSGRIAIEETLRAREAQRAAALGHSVPSRRTPTPTGGHHLSWAEIPAATIHPGIHRYGPDRLRGRATGAFHNGVPLLKAGEETKAVRAYLAETQSSFPSPYRRTRDGATT